MATIETTPEKQVSVPRFLYRQITYKPFVVKNTSLSGKTAIVTGSNTGVGFETARQLVDLGLSRLILAVRDEAKGKAAAAKLSSAPDDPSNPRVIEVWHLDLRDYTSVVAFAERAKAFNRLDIAVLNAGICPAKRIFNDKTGHDETIQGNLLSTALLPILLLPIAKAVRANQPAPSRITFTSSEVAALDTVDRMFVSKLLGQLFMHRLSKLVPPGRVAIINGASPGSVHDSEFNRDLDKTTAGAVIKTVMRRIANTAAVGARMMTDAAVNHGEEVHGQFLSFQKVVP
jgi:NAD(P)-dependent dehydrogenase (short-subunit alcohol dehydrogenase family)